MKGKLLIKYSDNSVSTQFNSMTIPKRDASNDSALTSKPNKDNRRNDVQTIPANMTTYRALPLKQFSTKDIIKKGDNPETATDKKAEASQTTRFGNQKPLEMPNTTPTGLKPTVTSSRGTVFILNRPSCVLRAQKEGTHCNWDRALDSRPAEEKRIKSLKKKIQTNLMSHLLL